MAEKPDVDWHLEERAYDRSMALATTAMARAANDIEEAVKILAVEIEKIKPEDSQLYIAIKLMLLQGHIDNELHRLAPPISAKDKS